MDGLNLDVMKKYSFIAMLAVVAMAAFSCAKEVEQKEEDVVTKPEKAFVPKVISAWTDDDVAPDTKTSLSGVSILWATTDNIKGWDCTTVHTSTSTAVSDGDKKADFTFDTVNVEDDLLYLAYPAENVSDIDNDFVYATIPTTQTATAGSFADKANVAVAEGMTDNPIFKNVGGLLSFTFNNDNITSVTLFADEDLTGASKISMDSDFAKATILDGKNFVTVSGTIANGSTYYAVVYPGTYHNLKIEVRNTAGQVATYTNPNALEVGRNANLHIATLEIPAGKWITPVKGSPYTWNLVSGDLGSNVEPYTPESSIDKGTPNMNWSAAYIWKSAAYFNNSDTKGVQVGSSGSPCYSLVLSTSDYIQYVQNIRINFSHASSGGASASVKVGDVSLINEGNTVVDASTTATAYVFSSAMLVKGEIEISFANAKDKAVYIKSIDINPDLRTPQTLSFPQAAYSVELTDGTFDNPGLTGANTSVTYTTDDPNEDYVSIDPATGDITLNATGTVHITATAAADETYQEGTASYTLTITDGPSSIAAVIAAANDATVYTSGVVAEVNAKGFIITDGTNNLTVYQNATPTAVEGQFVKVSGKRGTYNNVPQISSSPAPVITYGETGQSITRTSLTTITSSNCTGYTTSNYVQLAGDLSLVSSNYSISISDSDVVGRIYQPVTTKSYSGTTIPDMVGGVVNVTGYVAGSSPSLLYIAPTDIKFVKHAAPESAGAADNSSISFAVSANCGWTADKGTDANSIIKSVTYNSTSVTVTFNANAGDAKTAQVVITPAVETGLSPVNVTVTQSAAGVVDKTYTISWNSTNNSKGVSSYSNSWSVTSDGLTCNMENWNNNNNGWTYVKCGSKNDASTATIITNSSITEAIKTVTLNIGATNASNVTSVKVYVSDSTTFGGTAAGTFTNATGKQSVTLTPAANKYYKIEVVCKKSSNGVFQLNSLEFSTK